MSELTVEAVASIDNLLVIEQFEGWDHRNNRGYSAEYGVIPTANGDLGVLVEPVEMQEPPSVLYLGDRGSLTELRVIGTSYKSLRSVRSESTRNLKAVLGFSKSFSEGNTSKDKMVTTFPTSSYLNNVLASIYEPTGQKPHMTFANAANESGSASGKEFIERLAKGQIVISSPLGITSTMCHDLNVHIHGYCRIDPDTFTAIRRRAQQLQDEDKLQTLTDGTLSIEEAKKFAEMIERLSGFLGRDEYINDKEYLAEYLKEIVLGSEPTILRGAKVVQMRRGLARHRKWLDQRVQELRAA